MWSIHAHADAMKSATAMGRELRNRCSVREARHKATVCDSIYVNVQDRPIQRQRGFMAAGGGG